MVKRSLVATLCWDDIYYYIKYLIFIGLKVIVPPTRESDDRGCKLEESPGSMRTRCRLTAGEGDLRESATENVPPFSFG